MSETRTREASLASPATTNAEVDAILAGAGVNTPPVIEDVPDDTVKLPGGVIRDGKLIRTAVVRELNGADEEALSRALKTGSAFRFMDVLIERGTMSIGDQPATRELVKSLLIGDRDELAVAIRVATYGDELAIEQWECPACQRLMNLADFSLTNDLERITLSDPAQETTFEVPLRKGAKALVRLANGADQDAMWADDNWTSAERNSKLLSLCVMSLTDKDGQSFNVRAFPSLVLNLSIPDRQKILREVNERQPGPRYNEVKFKHEECGNEVILALGVADLFRDLIVFLAV